LQLLIFLLKLAIALPNAGKVHLRSEERLVTAPQDEVERSAKVIADEGDGFRLGARHARQELESASSVDLGIDREQRVRHARHFSRQKRTEDGFAEFFAIVVDGKHAVLRAGEARVRHFFAAGEGLDGACLADRGHAATKTVLQRADVVADFLADHGFREK
jgi:hypothetical protein